MLQAVDQDTVTCYTDVDKDADNVSEADLYSSPASVYITINAV